MHWRFFITGDIVYIVTAVFVTIPKKRKEFQQTLWLIADQLKKTSGCIMATYVKDPSDDNKFQLKMAWDNSASWESYQRTDDYKVLMGMKKLLTRDFNIDTKDLGNFFEF